MKENIKKMYDEVSPKGSAVNFADKIIEKAQTGRVKQNFITSPLVAVGASLALIIGAGWFTFNSDWLKPEIEESGREDASQGGADLEENSQDLTGILEAKKARVIFDANARDGLLKAGEEYNLDYKFYVDEFPAVTFYVSGDMQTLSVKEDLSSANWTTILLSWNLLNIYLCDLNGDNLPEICVSFWNGGDYDMVDTRALAYDYANQTSYILEEAMVYDYEFLLEDGALLLTKKPYGYSGALDYPDYYVGTPEIINNELVITNLVSRKHPDLDGKPLFEGGAPAILEDLADVERELYDIVYKLNYAFNIEDEVLNNYRYGLTDVEVGWNYLQKFLNDKYLTREEAIEDGFISEDEEYYGYVLRISDMMDVFAEIFLKERTEGGAFLDNGSNIRWSSFAGIGQVIEAEDYYESGKAWFQVYAHGFDTHSVMYLLDVKNEGDVIALTCASGRVGDYHPNDFVRSFSGILGEDEIISGYSIASEITESEGSEYYSDYDYYYYPEIAETLPKIQYVFAKTADGYKILSVNLISVGKNFDKRTRYDKWREEAEFETIVIGEEQDGELTASYVIAPAKKAEFLNWFDSRMSEAQAVGELLYMRYIGRDVKTTIFRIWDGYNSRDIQYIADGTSGYISDGGAFFAIGAYQNEEGVDVDFPFEEFALKE